MIYRGTGFLADVLFGFCPIPSLLSHQKQLAGVEGGGEEPNHTTARKPGPL
jgi:hypothetical protein